MTQARFCGWFHSQSTPITSCNHGTWEPVNSEFDQCDANLQLGTKHRKRRCEGSATDQPRDWTVSEGGPRWMLPAPRLLMANTAPSRPLVTLGWSSLINSGVQATENAMLRNFLSIFAALAVHTLSPQDAAMRRFSPVLETIALSSGKARLDPPAPSSTRQDANVRDQAAQGPIPVPVSAAGVPSRPIPTHTPVDLAAGAIGRRTLSTAFVRVGPDGHLTVELYDGRVLVLRDVVMRRKDYCGMQVLEGLQKTKYCGGYADIAAARAGG